MPGAIAGIVLTGVDGNQTTVDSQLCTETYDPCRIESALIDPPQEGFIESGTITPVAATPEPSSIALLGTGVIGVAGVLRKRLA